ncbi:rhodopsin-like [Uloborus diversus]|uniref:rhodopsin-like n=1 Tax=Uloborus diversus TaxID=327109 RepID=UPI002409E97C|nr:rhodopsin-like [Uloborus diversus]
MSALIETSEVDENGTIDDEVVSSKNTSVLPIANPYVASYLIVVAERVSHRKIVCLLLLCVLYSMSWCIGPVFGFGKYETFEVGCTIAFDDDTTSGRIFVNCAFIFVFFLPLLVTVYSYIAIVLEARKQRLLLERLGNVTCIGKSRLNVELKLVRSTSAIAAAYIIAWFPYAIVCLNGTYGDPEAIPWTFRIIAALFCKTATTTNPILYLFMSKGFRRETVETLQILLKCKHPSIVSSILYNFSQKSSSHPSSSQISLRSSWLSKQRKDHCNFQKIITSGSSSGEQTHYLSNIAETRV